MERELFSRRDLRNLIDGLTQAIDRLPPSVDLFRVGYLCALYDLARQIGAPIQPPLIRRPLPELRDLCPSMPTSHERK
jgi:hypothetical protein